MPIVRLGQSLCERVEVTKNGGFHSDPIAADGFWGRAHLRRLCPHPAGAQRAVGRGLHHLGLRDLAEPGFSGSRGFFVWRFLKTGGLAMLRMMNRPASPGHAHSCSLEDDQTEVDPERATAGAMRCIPTGFDFGSDRGEPHCCKKRFPPPHRSVVSGHSRPVGGASLPNY